MTRARLTLTRPDDWHLHLRDSDIMASVLPDTARRFARAIVMPNLKPPVTTTEQALAYRERILAALSAGMSFEPLMALHLTEVMLPEEIARAKASGIVHAVKYYPADATTNSEFGVADIKRCYPLFAAMERHDLPLLMHGEVTDPAMDAFDREVVFIERHLVPLTRAFPALRMVLEHITTTEARGASRSAGRRRHKRQPEVFSSAPTARRIPATPRSPPAAAPVSTPRTPPSSCTRKSSRPWARSTGYRRSPASMVPTSTGCRATGIPSPWRSGVGRYPRRCISGRKRACRCAPEKRLRGGWRDELVTHSFARFHTNVLRHLSLGMAHIRR